MKLKEEQLSADIRAGKLARVYYLYGREPFLVKTYHDRLIKKTVGADPLDFNLIKLGGEPDAGLLSDHVEGLPVFAERKVVAVNDLDPEKMDEAGFSRLLDIVSDVPETTVLIFSITGFQPDEKKSKTKKLIAAVDKTGVVCSLDSMPQPKIAELVIKKAAKQGVVISRENALYLAERLLGDLTLTSEETAKLISFAGSGGTIDRAMIDSLTSKRLDTGVFELATAINAGKRAEAFRIIDDLILEQNDPVAILAPLSSTYLDFYRAKLAKGAGVLPAQAAAEFSYPKNREWALNKAMNAVSRLSMSYLRQTLEILSEADAAMKSTPADSRTVLETAAVKLLDIRERR